jgi:hypothetical protein
MNMQVIFIGHGTLPNQTDKLRLQGQKLGIAASYAMIKSYFSRNGGHVEQADLLLLWLH